MVPPTLNGRARFGRRQFSQGRLGPVDPVLSLVIRTGAPPTLCDLDNCSDRGPILSTGRSGEAWLTELSTAELNLLVPWRKEAVAR